MKYRLWYKYQGRRHGNFEWRANRRKIDNLSPKYPKNAKDTGFGSYYSRTWVSTSFHKYFIVGNAFPHPSVTKPMINISYHHHYSDSEVLKM